MQSNLLSMVKKKAEPDLSEIKNQTQKAQKQTQKAQKIKNQAQKALNVHQSGGNSRDLSLVEKSLSKFKRYAKSFLFKVKSAVGPDSHSPRMEELKRKKNTQNREKMQKIAPYFRSFSQDQTKKLLEVSTKHLLDYYSKRKDGWARDVISEALAFVRETGNWKFRMCCCCAKPFSNDRLHIEHLMEKNHIEVLSTEQGSVKCLAFDGYWKSAIKGRTWTPINTSAVFPIVESRWNSELRKSNPWEWATTEDWPVSDDHERKDSLELIQKLLQGTNMAAEHMDMVIEYTMKSIEDLHPGQRDKFRQVGLDRTHFCICMLGASELDTVHEFFKELQELYKNHSAIHKIPMPVPMALIEDRILLNGDYSLRLLFGKKSLQGGSSSGAHTEKSWHIDKNASSATYAPGRDDSVPPNNDALLTLIFKCLSIEEYLMSWTQLKEKKVHCGKELLRELQITYNNLQSVCEEKLEKLSYKEALKAISGLCLEETIKRKSDRNNDHQSYKAVLRSRHQEILSLVKENDVSRRNKCELNAIVTVIEEAELKKLVSQEQSWNKAIFTICDLGSSKDTGFMLQKDLDEDGIEVAGAIERVRRRADFELVETGARMMRIWEDVGRITRQIIINSYNDYREILLSLVKSYLQELLKELADKDAIEKSEAAEKFKDVSSSSHHKDVENISALPGKDLDKQRGQSQLEGRKIKAIRIRVTGDGRCLFRALALGFLLRNGEAAPNEERQTMLADGLRAKVVDEIVKRRDEHAVGFIAVTDGNLEKYLEELKRPTSWGGANEILMATHVLKASISVFGVEQIQQNSFTNMADYGEEYKDEGKESIMLVWEKGGHYDLLTPN